MAAGKQKRRLNAPSVMRFNLHENSKRKKTKKLEASDVALNMFSHVSLEWDGCQNKAVAKREQVGISWRDMDPFLDHVPKSRSCLADVFSVPREIFCLESVIDVLSYEAWETCLSEQEKKLLVQFLPRGVDVDRSVQLLLEGDNLHFGNPVCKWGVSLGAGNLHPDAISHKEQQLRVDRNAYFTELKKYHTEIIERLSELKEIWRQCKNPEKNAEGKILRNGITKSTRTVTPERAKVPSGSEKEQPQEINMCYDDTKYISYFKISKKQHQLVRNMKQSGDGILSKSLNCILGDIKDFNIQPYAKFEEEERKKLHDHWLQLANKDLPAAFETRREYRLLVDKWRNSVQHELAGKKEWMINKDEKDSLRWSSVQHIDDTDSEQESAVSMWDVGHVQPVHQATECHHLERISSLHSHQELNPFSLDKGKELKRDHSIHHHKNDCHVGKIPSLNSPQEHKPLGDQGGNGHREEKKIMSLVPSKLNGHEDAGEDVTELKTSPDFSHQERTPSLDSHKVLCSMDVREGDQEKVISTKTTSAAWQSLGCVTSARDHVEAKATHSVSCSKDIWQQGRNEQPHSHPAIESQGYTSTGELSLRQSQVEESADRLIDLEAQMLDQEDAGSVALHGHNRAIIFNSYANQDHNLLLPPFHKEQVMLPFFVREHLNGLKQSEHFVATNDGLTRSSRFHSQYQEQEEILHGHNQSREKGLHMPQIPTKNMISGSRYPGQSHFPSVGFQDWTSLQSPVKGGLLGQNWFPAPGEHHTHAGWSGGESSGCVGRCTGDTAGSIDGGLLGMLSSSHVTSCSEHFPPGAYFVSRGSPDRSGIHTYPPLSSTSSRDVAALQMNSMAWTTSLSHQNPGLPESVRKLYLESWNQWG